MGIKIFLEVEQALEEVVALDVAGLRAAVGVTSVAAHDIILFLFVVPWGARVLQIGGALGGRGFFFQREEIVKLGKILDLER